MAPPLPLRRLGVVTLALLLSPLAAAQTILSVHTPCANCPEGVGPDLVPVTAQLQELLVCSATVGTTTTDNAVPVETTGFACAEERSTFVSAYVPAVTTDGSVISTLVTEIDQLITISYSATTSTITTTTVSTSTVTETATSAVARRDEIFESIRIVTKEVEVVVYDVVEYVYTTRYRDCGRHAVYGWEGSGLCPSEICGVDNEFQPIFTKECHNGNCITYECKWEFSSRASGGSTHGWYKKVIREEFDIEFPSPFPPAPPGCENVQSYYRWYDAYSGIWVWRSAWYTVPVIFGFPTQYPPGSCSYCQVPPGWGTTVIVIPGLTPVTTTITVPTTTNTVTVSPTAVIQTITTAGRTETVTVTSGPVVTETVSPLSCPQSDRTVYTTPDGSTFLIQCDFSFTGPEIVARTEEERSVGARSLGTTTFAGCIDLCDKANGCIAIVFFEATGNCRGYREITSSARTPGASAAKLIRKGSNTTTTSASAGATSTGVSVSQTSPGASQTSASQTVPENTTAAGSSTSTTSGSNPQSTSGGGGGGGGTPPANPININVQQLENAQATTKNGQPAFAFSVPPGGTARVAGDAPIPDGVAKGDGVQITFNAQVGQSAQKLRRRWSLSNLLARQNGADTGCTISALANGVTVFSSPLSDGFGQVQDFASSTFEATDSILIAIVTACDEGRSVELLVFGIGLAVVDALPTSTSASVGSSSTTVEGSSSATATTSVETPAQPTNTQPATAEETSTEPTTMQTVIVEPTTTTATEPEPSVAPPDLMMVRKWQDSMKRGRSRRQVLYPDLY